MPVKIIKFLFLSFILTLACSSDEPTAPPDNTPEPVLTKIVAIGNSLTAGVQSGGLVEDFQLNSYPYLITSQAGKATEFQQPLIASPGVGEIDSASGMVYGPLQYRGGEIVQGDPVPGGVDGLQSLLTNAFLPRAYDNLGLPGADLLDIQTATGGGIYDAVLRNPFFGNTTAVQQARSLNPTLILLWAGNNDVLGAALSGGDPSRITALSDFRFRYQAILAELTDLRDSSVVIMLANIPNVSDIAYVNYLDNYIFRSIPALGITTPVPVVFDANFQPVLFDTAAQLYVPLLTEEPATETAHLLLSFLGEYATAGMGIPDSTALVASGFSPAQATAILQKLADNNIPVSGQPIPASFTLTQTEEATIEAAVTAFNQVIEEMALPANILLVDTHTALQDLNLSGIDGFNGKFVLMDPVNTAFSLDGIHPNNAGYAIIANEFIKKLNELPEVNLPLLNSDQFRGQYSRMLPRTVTFEAARQARAYFVR